MRATRGGFQKVILSVLFASFLVSSSFAQGVLPERRLTPTDLPNFGRFGSSMAVSGNTLAVGSPVSQAGKSGAVYVYHFDGHAWVQEAKLTASDASSEDNFGAALALQGNTLVVGASEASPGALTDAGAVYVFGKANGVWTQQAELTATDASQFASLGISVAFDGKTIAAAALPGPGFGTPPGVVYVFVNNGTSWVQQAEIMNTDPSVLLFGVGLALQGNTLVAGAPDSTSVQGQFPGAAFVYTRTNAQWSQAATLIPSLSSTMAQFGQSATIDGNTIVVGAPGESTSLGLTGAAFVFTGSGATWTEQAMLTAGDPQLLSAFGAGLTLHKNELLIGAPGQNSQAGAAYLFNRSGTTWSQSQELSASSPQMLTLFGSGLALNSGFAFVGQSNAPVGNRLDAGTAWVFNLP